MTNSSQKFIARNRAPRVQIEYDVELYGSQKKVQLPFVMGVMSDLAGKSTVPQPSIENRKFLEIDVDNFDERMRAMQPRAAFSVPNTLTGEGNLQVDLTFEKMDDFSPQAIAAKIEPLRELLTARTQLSNLATYMDGKAGAEALIERILADPTLLAALSDPSSADADTTNAALNTLRIATTDVPEPADSTDATLDALRSKEVTEEPKSKDATAAALDALRAAEVAEPTPEDTTGTALDALRSKEVTEPEVEDTTGAALEALKSTPIQQETPTEDDSASALDALRAKGVTDTETLDDSAAALEALRAASGQDGEPEDTSAATLDALRASHSDAPEADDTASAALAALRGQDAAVPEPDDTADAALDALRRTEVAGPAPDDGADAALDALRGAEIEPVEPRDVGAAALDSLRQADASEPEETDGADTALEALRAAQVVATDLDDGADIALDALRATDVTEATAADPSRAALEALREVGAPEPEPDVDSGAALDALRDIEVTEPEKDESDAALSALRDIEVAEREAEDSGAALDALRNIEVAEPEADDGGAALEALRDIEVAESEAEDSGAALDALRDIEVEEPEADDSGAALDALRNAAPEPANAGKGPDDEPVGADTPATHTPLDASPDATAEDAAFSDDLDEPASNITTPPDPIQPPIMDKPPTPVELDAPEPETAPANDLDDLLGDLGSGATAPQASEAVPEPESAPTSDLDDLLDDTGADVTVPDPAPEPQPAAEGDLGDLLGDIETDAREPVASEPTPETETAPANDLDDLLGDLESGATAPQASEAFPEPESAPTSDLDDLLDDTGADVTVPDPAPEPRPAAEGDLGDLLGDIETDAAGPVASEPLAEPQPALGGDLDDLLGDVGTDAIEPEAVPEPEPASSGDLDDLPNDGADTTAPDAPEAARGPESAPGSDLDDLLGDLGSAPADPETPPIPEPTAEAAHVGDLDDLLGDIETDAAEPDAPDPAPEPEPAPGGDLDDLLGDLGADAAEPDAPDPEPVAPEAAPAGDLDDLLGDLGTAADSASAASAETGQHSASAPARPPEPEFAFGTMAADRPDAQQLNRKRFRLALMGDFSGRASRGLVETGDALAARPAILLDPDTVEEVISGFVTTLVLPIGKDGAGVEVKLTELDDLHPDELYENVALFAELVGLRSQLASGATAENAAQRLRAWGEAHGTPVAPTHRKSAGNAVPADRRLSDFQRLIGDTGASLTQPSPIDDLMARIVGPHIRAVPDADAAAMQAAVDDALSAAMRLVLHHPEFQSVEAQWRSIDLIARSIETDDTLEVMLYDISAEEIAADLSVAEDLSQSGFARLLTEAPLDEETGRGGYSALIGLYSFEETPPHAELLGRIGRVAAHVDAPFLAALSPAFMDIAKEDRHPLVATAWDTLRAMPEAGHLGLASPRFLLRRPYGAKSEPIYEFEFEEFTMAAGLGGMLWANPVVLVAILLAKSYRENGAGMGLGSIMSLGDMPYHFVTDRHGDQVALPCTERNLTLDKVEKVMARGVMPVVSIKGRDEIRLASFQSLAGGDILGPWSDVPPPPPSPPKPEPVAAPEPAAAPETAPADGAEDDLGLDDLLAGFADSAPAPDGDGGSDDIDADLAALLEDL